MLVPKPVPRVSQETVTEDSETAFSIRQYAADPKRKALRGCLVHAGIIVRCVNVIPREAYQIKEGTTVCMRCERDTAKCAQRSR